MFEADVALDLSRLDVPPDRVENVARAYMTRRDTAAVQPRADADATSARPKFGYGSTLTRLLLYAIIFVLSLGFHIAEMKTGYHLSRQRVNREHDPQSWSEVWAQLPGELPVVVFTILLIIVLIEWTIRRKMRKEESER